MKLHVNIVIVALLISACSNEKIQNVTSPSIALTSSPTVTRTQQSTLTITITPNPTKTQQYTGTEIPLATATITGTAIDRLTQTITAQANAKATIDTFGTICQPPARDSYAVISPDGKWIAMVCQGVYGEINSYLKILSIQGDDIWSIHYEDYTKGIEVPNIDSLVPFHWSKDGKYLYIMGPSKMDGCCWIGDDLLLIRVNLQNGQQTEIVNYVSDGSGEPGVDISISSDDRYVLIPLWRDLYILDLYTWKQRVVELMYRNIASGFTIMSPDDRKIILVVRQYPEEIQGDLTYGSLVLVDLVDGTQKKISSDYEWWDNPQPIAWTDNDHVLICPRLYTCSDNQYFLLNINTGELTDIYNP